MNRIRASRIFPCAICGARDARDEQHAQGCPKLAPVAKAEVYRLALALERAWAAAPPRAILPKHSKGWIRANDRELREHAAMRRRSA